MSVRRSDVSALTLRDSGASLFQRSDGAHTTPDRTSPSTSATNVQLPRALNIRTLSPLMIPRGSASSRCNRSTEVWRWVQVWLPKVEFMLSWLLAEIISSGNFECRSAEPKRDSVGGWYSRASAWNSHLPEGVPKPPRAKGR